jgi:hypothetical protein
MTLAAVELAQWVPFGFRSTATGPAIDWCHIGTSPFEQPFFDQTIQRRLGEGARARYREAGLESLDRVPPVRPSGFIFHMSRCGSTLLTQMLAAVPRFVALSEPAILDTLLQGGHPSALLERVLSALGQPRTGIESSLFLKFTSRAVLHLPRIRLQFPDVPWIFLYRNPLEVLVSLVGSQHDALPPGLSDGDRNLRPAEYWALLLASRCNAALQAFGDGRNARLVNYDQLPGLLSTSILPHFGVTPSDEELDRMSAAGRQNAKNPAKLFQDDRRSKERDATDEMRAAADRYLTPCYEQLEALRKTACRRTPPDRTE